MARTWALLLSLGWRLGAQPEAFPAFDQLRVTQVFSGQPARPILRTPDDRMFRNRIREGAAEGPNFAGHYTIAEWGCGAGCVQMALIDAVDGRIYRGPFQVLSWELLEYEGKLASNDDRFEPLDFQKGSRLLIVRGCPEEKNCASYFYELAGSQFKLIRKVGATRIPPKQS
jgi:hypothetical protein